MAIIVTRQTGATSVARPLTNTELDNNFINLNTAVVAAITGPASATDNALVRFDTTTGKLAQDSLVTVDDAGKLIATGLLSTGSSGVTISNGNTVTGIVKVATGTGYTSPPTIAISAPTTVGGITATATTGLQLGSVAGIVISGGTGYQVGDDFYLVGGTFTTQMRLRVATLSGSAVATVTSVNGGEYSVIPSTPATTTTITGTGSGCTITPIWTTSNTTTITNAGSGYVEQPTVSFSGGGGGGASAYATVGSDTTIKSLGTVLNLNTDNGTGFRVTTSGQTATNYWQALGHGLVGILRSSGATADGQIHTSGTGGLQLGTNSGTIQARIGHTPNAVNYLQLIGSTTGSGSPTISTQGSDTNVGLILLAKGNSPVEFRNDPAATAFGIELASNTTVDKSIFIDFHSSASTDYDFRLARDGGVNNSVTYANAGTGNHRFLTTGVEQFRIAHTASAVNYVQITGGTAGSGPVISAQGTDTNINLTLNVKNSAGVIINANQRDNTPFGGSANIVALGTAQAQVTSLSFKPTFVGSADNGPRRIGEISVGFTSNWGSEYMNLGVGGINANDGNFIPKTVLQLTNPNSAVATPAVNYFGMRGSTTGVAPVLSVAGTDTNIDLILTPKGTGVVKTTSGLYLSEAGGSGGRLQITSASSGGVINQADNSPLTFKVNTVNALELPMSASAVNYAQLYNSATGNAIWLRTNGTDTNVSLALQSKGTGAINLAAGSSGVNVSNGTTVTAITRTNGGGNYTTAITATLSAPTTVGGVQATAIAYVGATTVVITSAGTGYAVNNVLTVVGGTGIQAQTYTVSTVSGGIITGITIQNYGQYTVLPTNPVSVTGGGGSGATLTLSNWSMTNIAVNAAGSGYVEQPTVTLSGSGGSGAAAYATVGAGTIIRTLNAALDFYTPNQQIAFRVQDYSGSTAAGYWVAFGGNTSPVLRAVGATSGQIQTASAVPLSFQTNMVFEQLRIAHTTNAVNYLQVTGAVSGSANGPTISAQGSDTNVPLNISSKNAGAMTFIRQRDAAASNPYLFSFAGGLSSDAGGGAFWRGVHVSAPNYTISSVNKFARIAQYFEFDSVADPTYKNAYYAISNASGENIESIQANDTGGGWTFKNAINNSLDKSFRIAAPLTTDRNYFQVAGAAAGASPVLSAQGTDTNIDLALTPKGTGKVVVSGPIQIDTQLILDAATTTTTAVTANQVIAAYDTTVYRAAKLLIRAVDVVGAKYQACEMLAIHNGSTANSTEYAAVNIGGVCATFDVDYSNNTIRLLATPASANSTVFTVAVQLLK